MPLTIAAGDRIHLVKSTSLQIRKILPNVYKKKWFLDIIQIIVLILPLAQ